jgi:vacuolar-type H+-ATPase subunit F/Vma7
MARLVVLANPALADGFRLAGCATTQVRQGEAALALRGLVSESDVGLVLVTADLWAELDDRLRGSVERLARPIVLPIPAGVVTDATTRRRMLGEMLERAIGYRVELSSGAVR